MDPVVLLYMLVNRYVTGDLPLAGLREQVVPLLPHFAEAPPDDAATQLALLIDNILVEMDLGEASEDDLRTMLAAIPTSSVTVHMARDVAYRAASDASTDVLTLNVLAFRDVTRAADPAAPRSSSRTQLVGASA